MTERYDPEYPKMVASMDVGKSSVSLMLNDDGSRYIVCKGDDVNNSRETYAITLEPKIVDAIRELTDVSSEVDENGIYKELPVGKVCFLVESNTSHQAGTPICIYNGRAFALTRHNAGVLKLHDLVVCKDQESAMRLVLVREIKWYQLQAAQAKAELETFDSNRSETHDEK